MKRDYGIEPGSYHICPSLNAQMGCLRGRGEATEAHKNRTGAEPIKLALRRSSRRGGKATWKRLGDPKR